MSVLKNIGLVLVVSGMNLMAQTFRPGGVEGAVLWQKSELNSLKKAQWTSVISTNDSVFNKVTGNALTINNNPAVELQGAGLKFPEQINPTGQDSYCLFMVCLDADQNQEQAIFSVDNDTAYNLVITNKRMADLEAYKYYRIFNGEKPVPKIYSFTKNQTDQKLTNQSYYLFGQNPRRSDLPVERYQGAVPEIILMKRMVSFRERCRIESYLAIKYGISLKQDFPTSYLNSSGDIIWHAGLNSAYNNCIAGIGRDDLSGLNQMVSESSESPGILKVSLLDKADDKAFLIWGDNGGKLRFNEADAIRIFQRVWKTETSTLQNKRFELNSNELLFDQIHVLKNREYYWLMIDKTGSGAFPVQQTSYVRAEMNLSSFNKSIHFGNVMLDEDSSGFDAFTFLVAPAFFTRSQVISPDCDSPESGIIQTDFVGGKLPYSVELMEKENETSIERQITTKNYHQFNALNQGEYVLKVTDANGQVFTETILVSNVAKMKSGLEKEYQLEEGTALVLDASGNKDVQHAYYTWKLPDGNLSNSEKLNIDQAGVYTLTITDNAQCSSIQKIKILERKSSEFGNIQLFPNPVREGDMFVIRMEMNDISDVFMQVIDLEGRNIFTHHFKGKNFYHYAGLIQNAGMYSVILQCGNEIKSYKIIVNP